MSTKLMFAFSLLGVAACSSAPAEPVAHSHASEIASWRCEDSDHAGRQYWTCDNGSIHRCDDAGRAQIRVCKEGCVLGPLGTDDVCNGDAAPASGDGDAWGSAVLARAQSWVDQGVMYSHDPDYEGYRTDCSGLVSYAWGLAAPGHVTYTLAGGADDDGVSYAIAWDDLQPGDALNFGGDQGAGSGHVILFAGWTDSAHVTFDSYEEEHEGLPALHHVHSKNDDWNYGIGTIGQIYQPIRAVARGGTPPSATTNDHGAWSCADSDWNGQQIWTCQGSYLHRCENGAPVARGCANGCIVEPLGVDDVCR